MRIQTHITENYKIGYLPAKFQGHWLDGGRWQRIGRCVVGVGTKTPGFELRFGQKKHSKSEVTSLGRQLKYKHFACILPRLVCILFCTTLLQLDMFYIDLPTSFNKNI